MLHIYCKHISSQIFRPYGTNEMGFCELILLKIEYVVIY